ILPAVGGKGLAGLMHLDAVNQELFNQRRGGRKIVLPGRYNICEWGLLSKSLDIVPSGLIAIVQERFPVPGSRVEHSHRSAHVVADSIAEPPPAAFPRAAVKDLGPQWLVILWKLVDCVEMGRGIAVQGRLSEECDTIAKDVGEIEKA